MRILVYSHDTFGFGNIRRNSALARHLVDSSPDAHALLVTGSRWVHLLKPHPRIQIVKLPEVVRSDRGLYRSRSDVSLRSVIRLRREIIRGAAKGFRPDLFLVDKVPRGLHGELDPTLERLEGTGCSSRLVLRDILDEPEWTRASWERTDQYAALERHFDETWVFGDPEVFPTAEAYGLDRLRTPVRYCGYLLPEADASDEVRGDRRLLTVGGGEDGAWVLDAFTGRSRSWTAPPTDVVFGPFLESSLRSDFKTRLAPMAEVRCHDFVSDLSPRIRNAPGVVSMAGYNSICEILAHRTPTLVIPREKPSREQGMRAERMSRLGYFRTVPAGADLGDAIREFVANPTQERFPRPRLNGLATAADLVKRAA